MCVCVCVCVCVCDGVQDVFAKHCTGFNRPLTFFI